MKLTFLGAAGEVTGSQHLIETEELRILLDCGMFQGRREESRKKNEQFHCEPKKLDCVILSHAHIDHSGNLPGLYRAGFRGPIYCTRATADVAGLMLQDSARIQAEDAQYLNRHLAPGERPVEPLYSVDEATATEKLFEPLEYGVWEELSPCLKVRLSDAGHILGSAIVELQIEDRGEMRRLVFTGDLGRRGLPLLHDPTPVGGCDVLITESTYGNRVHPPAENLRDQLRDIILDAVERKGRVIIPAFSLGRTQQIVYFLNQLREAEVLPEIPVFVDSPLATRLTNVFRRHDHLLDDYARRWLEVDDDLFRFKGLHYVQTQRESMELNYRTGPFVVISASGMCENGRVVHHLKHSLEQPENTVVIIGFQAAHTLGRRLVEKREKVRIFGRDYQVRARIEKLNGLSAHADVEDFRWWFEQMAREGGIGQAFLVHGEADSARDLAIILADYCDEDPVIPARLESFEV